MLFFQFCLSRQIMDKNFESEVLEFLFIFETNEV